MRTVHFLFLALSIISCAKEQADEIHKCFNSINGNLTDEITGKPIVGAKVFGQGVAQSDKGWSVNIATLPIDTIITDDSGYFEFSSEYEVPAWNIQTFAYGYDFTTQTYYDAACEETTKNISIPPMAVIRVSTIDDPDLNHDSVYVFVVPGHGYDYGVKEYGISATNMTPGQTVDLHVVVDVEFNRIDYRYLGDQNSDFVLTDMTPSFTDTLEFEIRM